MSKRTREIADYIRAITSELASLAKTENLHFIAYLLRLVTMEAGTQAAIRAPIPRRTPLV